MDSVIASMTDYNAYSSKLYGQLATTQDWISGAAQSGCHQMREVVSVFSSSTFVFIQIVRTLILIFKDIVVAFLKLVAITCSLCLLFRDIQNIGNARSANNEPAGRNEELTTSMVEGVTNAVSKE